MQIVIIEVEKKDAYNSLYQIQSKDTFIDSWNQFREEYGITDEFLEELKVKGVIGWVDCVAQYGKEVQRTYMLVPN